jgi:hypothetical protein
MPAKTGMQEQYREVSNSTSLNRDEVNSRDAINAIKQVGWMQ